MLQNLSAQRFVSVKSQVVFWGIKKSGDTRHELYGVGKTAFCKAFVKEKGLKTLRVNHKQDFRRLDASYDAVLIDDAGICEFSVHDLTCMLMMTTKRSSTLEANCMAVVNG
jgi:hypothetical protein